MSICGRLWHPGMLEDRVEQILRTWLPFYLKEAAWQETQWRELPALRAAHPADTEAELIARLKTAIEDEEISLYALREPESWGTASEYDRFPEKGLPAIIIAAGGMATDPTRRGDGYLRGDWPIEVSVTLSAASEAGTRRAAQVYLAAIVGAILQRRSLGDPYSAAELADIDYADIRSQDRRSRMAAAAAFTVKVGEMVSTNQGPVGPEPPDPVPDDWPVVLQTNIETEITS